MQMQDLMQLRTRLNTYTVHNMMQIEDERIGVHLLESQ